MAGQPQEPSWQPLGQEQTQGRPAWPQQPPAYTMPGVSPQDANVFAPQYGQQAEPQYGQAAEPQYGQAAEPQYRPQPGQGYPPPWTGQEQYAPGTAARAAKSPGEKGFFGSLFDFSFNSFVTPKIIKVLYVLFTIWTVIWALIILRLGFHYGAAAGIFVLLVVEPIFILLTLGVYRVILEAFMVIFRIYEETKKLRERGES